MKWINFDIDENIHARFKTKCAENKISMQDKVIEMIKEFIGDE